MDDDLYIDDDAPAWYQQDPESTKPATRWPDPTTTKPASRWTASFAQRLRARDAACAASAVKRLQRDKKVFAKTQHVAPGGGSERPPAKDPASNTTLTLLDDLIEKTSPASNTTLTLLDDLIEQTGRPASDLIEQTGRPDRANRPYSPLFHLLRFALPHHALSTRLLALSQAQRLPRWTSTDGEVFLRAAMNSNFEPNKTGKNWTQEVMALFPTIMDEAFAGEGDGELCRKALELFRCFLEKPELRGSLEWHRPGFGGSGEDCVGGEARNCAGGAEEERSSGTGDGEPGPKRRRVEGGSGEGGKDGLSPPPDEAQPEKPAEKPTAEDHSHHRGEDDLPTSTEPAHVCPPKSGKKSPKNLGKNPQFERLVARLARHCASLLSSIDVLDDLASTHVDHLSSQSPHKFEQRVKLIVSAIDTLACCFRAVNSLSLSRDDRKHSTHGRRASVLQLTQFLHALLRPFCSARQRAEEELQRKSAGRDTVFAVRRRARRSEVAEAFRMWAGAEEGVRTKSSTNEQADKQARQTTTTSTPSEQLYRPFSDHTANPNDSLVCGRPFAAVSCAGQATTDFVLPGLLDIVRALLSLLDVLKFEDANTCIKVWECYLSLLTKVHQHVLGGSTGRNGRSGAGPFMSNSEAINIRRDHRSDTNMVVPLASLARKSSNDKLKKLARLSRTLRLARLPANKQGLRSSTKILSVSQTSAARLRDALLRRTTERVSRESTSSAVRPRSRTKVPVKTFGEDELAELFAHFLLIVCKQAATCPRIKRYSIDEPGFMQWIVGLAQKKFPAVDRRAGAECSGSSAGWRADAHALPQQSSIPESLFKWLFPTGVLAAARRSAAASSSSTACEEGSEAGGGPAAEAEGGGDDGAAGAEDGEGLEDEKGLQPADAVLAALFSVGDSTTLSSRSLCPAVSSSPLHREPTTSFAHQETDLIASTTPDQVRFLVRELILNVVVVGAKHHVVGNSEIVLDKSMVHVAGPRQERVLLRSADALFGKLLGKAIVDRRRTETAAKGADVVPAKGASASSTAGGSRATPKGKGKEGKGKGAEEGSGKKGKGKKKGGKKKGGKEKGGAPSSTVSK